ncbi:hypothetical protein [Nocardia terpenica]|uniref:Uncharacterized protein n=1 Tax=Nocardia terpenica TaxID=455432 RepID=A0A6G9YY78_9NOCA|nr:hypothetical protein [Nocardia terpenica]QIS18164.1 hypothetical protein F6W96_07465 [Nocardia terpenica]
MIRQQAGIRDLFHRDGFRLWDLLAWVPGGWGGRTAVALIVLALLAVAVRWIDVRMNRSSRERLGE